MKESDNWYYKHSPKTLDEMCLTSNMRNLLTKYIQEKQIPHLILYGNAGIGKTTLYDVLKNELEASGEKFDGSTNRSINLLRDEIPEILSRVCFSDNYHKKIIFLDEFENISKDSMLALKGTIDAYDHAATFLFATNTLSEVISQVIDRCEMINLEPNSIEEKKELLKEYARRGKEILIKENVEFDLEVFKTILARCYPSMRNFIKTLQSAYNKYGKISEEVLEDESIFALDKIITCLKVDNESNWKVMRKIVSQMQQIDHIYTEVYAKIEPYLKQSVLKKVVKIVADYSFKCVLTKNKEITAVAFFTELMEVINGNWIE